ncbi:MFS transporter [Actinomadura livida]|uniref:MFS transporter n=1 Tax=Actinomadura livida TaxID=79909 RepID=A0A7W7N140_9ACTN|nr:MULTISPECIES: MFS transporter [Actinomadura]MBB4778656.1 putative MFS family arabinose efflux permease [Actinomadura catellatispora]GGU30614.1 MFS transporter [Actinomadura livida]
MTHIDAPASAGPVPEHVSLKRWLAVAAVAVGTFLVVTAEQLPVGLLTSVGGDFGISKGTAGLMVTVPGLVAAVSALLVPVMIGRLDRRAVLIGLITLMVVANALSFLAPNFPTLLAARFLIGISIGGFWALAAGIAVRLVPEAHVGRATSIAFGGATAANVLGVPAGTLIGGLTDWRIAFLTFAGLGLVALSALFALLPRIPADDPVRLGGMFGLFRIPAVRALITTTFLLVTGHLAAYTFVSPILQEVSGVDEKLIGPLLLVFGVAGIVGTFAGGSAAARNVRATLVAVAVLITLVLALFPLVGVTLGTGVAFLVLWGLAFGGYPVAVQMWIFKAAPGHTEAVTALNTVVFNLAIALGALFGGLIVDGASTTAALWFAAVLTALTLLTVRTARKV